MLTHAEVVEAREALLVRTVSFFAERPDVVGIILAGSLAAGLADAYSDIDLRVIATPEELRSHMVRLDAWIHELAASSPHDLKMSSRLSPALANALALSYVGLDAPDLDDAVVALSEVLRQQIPELHRKFQLNRPLASDLSAVDLVAGRQVA